jgi:dihydroorotate dehydrogenase electron transfer subunit
MTPVHQSAEVLAVAAMGRYVALTAIAPAIAATAQPGQLVAVSTGGPQSAMLLRRAFPVHAVTPAADYAGTVQFVVDPDGPGRKWLAERRAGDVLDLVGPIGRPFALPAEPGSSVLVGEGAGAAALIPLARALIATGSTVEIVLGAPTSDGLFGQLLARRTAGEVTVTTEDGSAGERGRVSDVLPLVISRSRAVSLYAAGSAAMLETVSAAAAAHGLPAQVLLNGDVPCGTGLCQGCVVPVTGVLTPGATGTEPAAGGFARLCVEGPVFAADQVRWDQLTGAAGGAGRSGASGTGAVR